MNNEQFQSDVLEQLKTLIDEVIEEWFHIAIGVLMINPLD